jgi:hypothetical protein
LPVSSFNTKLVSPLSWTRKKVDCKAVWTVWKKTTGAFPLYGFSLVDILNQFLSNKRGNFIGAYIINMEVDRNTEAFQEILTSGNESPKGGVGGNEHCVAIISRKARVLYMYKGKKKLK